MPETVVVIPPTETPAEIPETTVAEQAAEIVETAEQLAEKMSRSSDESQAILFALAELSNVLAGQHAAMMDELRTVTAELVEIRARLDGLEEAEEEEAEEIAEEIKEELIETPPPAPVEIPPEEAAPTAPQKRGRKWI